MAGCVDRKCVNGVHFACAPGAASRSDGRVDTNNLVRGLCALHSIQPPSGRVVA
jgi:hypothetical protein